MSGAGGQGDDKNSMAILWIIGFIFLAGVILWFAFSTQIKLVFIKFRWLEIWIISLFINLLPSSVDTIAAMQKEVAATLQVTNILEPNGLTLETAGVLSDVVGRYWRFPFTICLAVFCYLMYGRNVKMRYRKVYNMNSLAEQESKVWPQINPVLNANIESKDLDEGPWAMAMTPLNFCKKYKLISISVEMPKNALSQGPKFNMVLNETRTNRLFAAQLGRLWQGADRLPIHRRAIFAALIARGCRDTKASRNLLNQINESCVGGSLDKLNFQGTDELIKKHINNRAIQDIISNHAYESTVFTSALLFAREDGVLATADFLWLKPFDRKFWYFLNNVGRQVAFCEAAGVHAHFLAEKALQRSLGVPMVKEATKALKLALSEIIYVPSSEEKDELLKQASEKEQA